MKTCNNRAEYHDSRKNSSCEPYFRIVNANVRVDERKIFPMCGSSRTSSCDVEWREGGRGGGYKEQEQKEKEEVQGSAWNRSLTAVLHAALSLFFFPLVLAMVIARAMPRRATPRNAARCSSSYGPPGVPGHSSGNRSASIARGTR